MTYRPFLAAILLALLLAPLCAVAGVKNVEETRPRFGQQGTTVEVTIRGVSINSPREIIFFKSGIRAFDFSEPEEQPRRRGFAHGGYYDSAITCKFEIAPDCTPGEYPFRLLTDTQLSHLGTFYVSPFPVISESADSKSSADKAQSVTPNVTINGMLSNDLSDWFRVSVTKGQQLSVELDSVRISDQNYGDSEYDLAVCIVDGAGRVIAANDDNSLHIQDPITSTIMKETGGVFVVVERSVAQVASTPYALHIGHNRRPVVAFPPGGPVGATQTFQMLGDVGGAYQVELAIPAKEGAFEYFGEAPSPVMLRASELPNVLEQNTGPTNTPMNPSSNTVEAALNGVIDSYDDTDTYRMQVKQGEPLHVRVFAAALGSPIDPLLRIRDADGKIELEADDAKLTERDVFCASYRAGGGRPEILDPSIVWTPQSDGEYLLEISDSSGNGGPTGVYRVEIQPLRTVVQTVLSSKTFDWTESTRVTGLAIPRGGRRTVNVTLPQGQWKSPTGELDLVAQGLPPGVRLVSPRLKPGVTFWPIQFIAEETAKPGGSIITLEARPVDSATPLVSRSQENIPFLNHPGGDALKFVQTDRYILGVTDPAPFKLDLATPKAALVRGGELAIPVTVSRAKGFDAPIEYSVRFVHPAVSFQPPTVIPAGEMSSLLRLSASSSAPLGSHPLVIMGRSLEDEIPRSMGAGDVLVSSEIVEFRIAEPYVELSSQPESIRRGQSKKLAWKVQHKTPFQGQARVRLLGLPKGVRVIGDPVVSPDSPEVLIAIEADQDALLGQITGLSCEITLSVDGQEVTQRTGSGSLRIDPAVKP